MSEGLSIFTPPAAHDVQPGHFLLPLQSCQCAQDGQPRPGPGPPCNCRLAAQNSGSALTLPADRNCLSSQHTAQTAKDSRGCCSGPALYGGRSANPEGTGLPSSWVTVTAVSRESGQGPGGSVATWLQGPCHAPRRGPRAACRRVLRDQLATPQMDPRPRHLCDCGLVPCLIPPISDMALLETWVGSGAREKVLGTVHLGHGPRGRRGGGRTRPQEML